MMGPLTLGITARRLIATRNRISAKSALCEQVTDLRDERLNVAGELVANDWP